MLTPESRQTEQDIGVKESSPEEGRDTEGKTVKGLRRRNEEAREIIKCILKGVEGVDARIKGCGNTRRDVKEASTKVRSIADRAIKKGILHTLEDLMKAAEENRTAKNDEGERTERKDTKTASTQTKN